MIICNPARIKIMGLKPLVLEDFQIRQLKLTAMDRCNFSIHCRWL